jgi:hypothetical protein
MCHNTDWKTGTWPSSENLATEKFAQDGYQKCHLKHKTAPNNICAELLWCNEMLFCQG